MSEDSPKPPRGRPPLKERKLVRISSTVPLTTYERLYDIAREKDASLSKLIRSMLTASAFAQKVLKEKK